MTPELLVLVLAALLQCVQFVLVSIVLNRDLDPSWTMSPRDRPPKNDLSVTGGRLKRALDNHFEGLILFTIAAVVISVSGQSGLFTATCAWIYLAARIAYVPAYVFGLQPGRSVIWGIGWVATVLMLVAALI